MEIFYSDQCDTYKNRAVAMRRKYGNLRSIFVLYLLLVVTLMSDFRCSRDTPEGIKGKVKVVTTTQTLADWVRNVGGQRVEVKSILTGLENPHTYEPKPGDVADIHQADILVKVGVGLEEWVGGVVKNARNEHLLVVDASQSVNIVDKSENSPGNPHIWLDPGNAKIMIDNIIQALVKVDSQGEKYYQQRSRAYFARLDSLTEQITKAAQQLKSRKVIAYHPAWPYFARRFGFQIVDYVERVPGKEPSAKHITYLVDLIRKEHIKVICCEPQLSSDIPQTLAKETGAEVIILTPLLNGTKGTDTYLKMIKYNASKLIEALRE